MLGYHENCPDCPEILGVWDIEPNQVADTVEYLMAQHEDDEYEEILA